MAIVFCNDGKVRKIPTIHGGRGLNGEYLTIAMLDIEHSNEHIYVEYLNKYRDQHYWIEIPKPLKKTVLWLVNND